jgi:hypothetical protein
MAAPYVNDRSVERKSAISDMFTADQCRVHVVTGYAPLRWVG